jgi:hypothetical protein
MLRFGRKADRRLMFENIESFYWIDSVGKGFQLRRVRNATGPSRCIFGQEVLPSGGLLVVSKVHLRMLAAAWVTQCLVQVTAVDDRMTEGPEL